MSSTRYRLHVHHQSLDYISPEMDMGRVYNKRPEGLAAYPFHGCLVSYAHYTVALSSRV